jgi:hypothetical protein
MHPSFVLWRDPCPGNPDRWAGETAGARHGGQLVQREAAACRQAQKGKGDRDQDRLHVAQRREPASGDTGGNPRHPTPARGM